MLIQGVEVFVRVFRGDCKVFRGGCGVFRGG